MNAPVIKVAHWQVAPDEPATRIAYENIQAGPGCDCGPCRNFEKLGSGAFPPVLHEILRVLGIDYTKPAEIYHLCRLDSGLHSYGGWYHFIGSILAGEDCLRPANDTGTWSTIDTEPIGDTAGLGLSNKAVFVHDAFAGHPVIQLDITLELPWVLDEEEPD